MTTDADRLSKFLSRGISFVLQVVLLIGGTLVGPTATPPAFASQSFISISAGYYHTCAVTQDGNVKCWGRNDLGLLGDGTNLPRANPVMVTGLSAVRSVSAGYLHTCALTNDGTVKCWGSNGRGRLGDGTTQNRFSPVTVVNLNDVVAISAGYLHTCALISDGTVKCWGFNGQGRLGDGTSDSSSTPVLVSGISNAESISAGYFHTCALTTDKKPLCWGSNDFGQLGDGSAESRMLPVEVVGLSSVTSIVAGTRHSCALLATKTVSCWGSNELGLLGDGTVEAKSSKVQVLGLDDVNSLALGVAHSCALKSNGKVSCWGSNEYHQLGNLSSAFENQATEVSSQQGVQLLTTTGFHNCVQTSAGQLICWGSNDFGQVTGGPSSLFQDAVPVVGLTNTFYKWTVPVINGEPVVGQTLVADTGDWDEGVAFTYQWLRDGKEIPGANSTSYLIQQEDLVARLGLKSTASKPTFDSKIVYSEPTNPVWYKNLSQNSLCQGLGQLDNTNRLAIVGVPKPNQTLRGQPGFWTVGTKLCSFWLRDSQVVPGATQSYYRLGLEDIGKSIRYVVVGTSKSGDVKAKVSEANFVTKLTFDRAAPAKLIGQPRVGLKMSAIKPSWAKEITYSYQWLSDGSPISGANNLSYFPTAQDAGRSLSLLVCGTNTSYTDRCIESEAKVVELGLLKVPSGLAILGNAKVGSQLAVKLFPTPVGAQISIQWFRNGVAIPSTNSPTYVITPGDRGKSLSARIQILVDGYEEVVKTAPDRRIY